MKSTAFCLLAALAAGTAVLAQALLPGERVMPEDKVRQYREVLFRECRYCPSDPRKCRPWSRWFRPPRGPGEFGLSVARGTDGRRFALNASAVRPDCRTVALMDAR